MAQGPGRRVRLGRAWRRLALACLLVGAVVATPTIAWAKFTSKTSAAVSAGSATLAAPTSIAFSGTCPNPGTGSVKVTFTNASRATSYQVVLDPPLGSNVTKTTTSGTTEATFSLTRDGTYTVYVTSLVQNWSSVAATKSFTC